MPYFSNRSVNRINLHYGLHMLGWNFFFSFFIVFLISQGFSPTAAILTFTAMLSLRMIFRPLILFAAPRVGLHRTIIVGLILCMFQYMLFARMKGIDAFFFAFCVLQALSDCFFWTSFHSIFAIVGDNSHRGKQVGIREVFATSTAIVSPLLGGWLLDHVGQHVTFGLAAACDLLAIIPILGLPPIRVPAKIPEGLFKAGRSAIALFTTDAWIYTGFGMVWGIVLYTGAGRGFTAFGGALTLAAIVSVMGGVVLGRFIDKGHGPRAVVMSAVLLTAAILFRATAQPTFVSVYGVAMASALVTASYNPTLMTALYTVISKAQSPFHLVFMMEYGWDIGGILGTLACAALIHFGAPFGFAIALALFAVPFQAFLLRRYYKNRD
jgi:MFS family permease